MGKSPAWLRARDPRDCCEELAAMRCKRHEEHAPRLPFVLVWLRSLFLLFAAGLALASVSTAGGSQRVDPSLQFFDGETEMTSVVRVAMRKPYHSRTVSHGTVSGDGSLTLVQQVYEEGKPPRLRRWAIRQVAPGRFTGSMSEAVGPVDIDQVDGKYRFRFRMKGSLAVEQWLVPLPGGQAAQSHTTVKKWGIRVATSEGTIRRL